MNNNLNATGIFNIHLGISCTNEEVINATNEHFKNQLLTNYDNLLNFVNFIKMREPVSP